MTRPDGDMKEQLDVIESKVKTWATNISASALDRSLVWTGLRGTIWKTIEYVLPFAHFNKTQWISLHKHLYRPVLPKAGATRSFPLILRYAPAAFYGLGLPDGEILQGTAKINFVLRNGASGSLAGDALLATLEQLQLEAGISQPVLQQPFSRFDSWTTTCWWKHVWEFLSNHNIHLHNNSLEFPQPQREHDRVLAEIFLADGLDTKTLQSLQRCRCYMECTTIADIATGSGTHIRQSAFDLTPDVDQPSTLGWGREEPSRSDRNQWRDALLRLTNGGLKLSQPLGAWTHTPHKTWAWY